MATEFYGGHSMPLTQATTIYCCICSQPGVLMDDGRCGRCTLADPPLPSVGAWAMGHEDANDEDAREFKRAWERLMAHSEALRSAKAARAAAQAEWEATGEAGVRARWL